MAPSSTIRLPGRSICFRRQGRGLPQDLGAAILITVHPNAVANEVLRRVDTLVGLGEGAAEVVETVCSLVGRPVPENLPKPGHSEILFYSLAGTPSVVRPERPVLLHKRHTRKYAEGELGEDRSFYFKAPEGTLNLRAQNLRMFSLIGAGVDDRTWEFHRRAGDYSNWIRGAIKDEELANEVAEVEKDRKLGATESRKRISDAIARRYTPPSKSEGA